ncbi:MAG: DUF4416 family protein [Sedimentisphaerales bacterium]|nr:DUF4416 family protein [Sedimentisphaerales bacterium]
MWELKEPRPVKLIIGILAADKDALATAVGAIGEHIGKVDLISDVWPFTQTDYYKDETGGNILRQFVSIEELVDPGKLAEIKHATNKLEQELAAALKISVPRPVNMDPGLIEPSKLVLATTKNYSHRIYIGNKMFAEVTLIFEKAAWRHFEWTYPDYRQQCYQEFFSKVRSRLLEQLRTER